MRNNDPRSRCIAILPDTLVNGHLLAQGDRRRAPLLRAFALVENAGFGIVQLPPDDFPLEPARASLDFALDQIADYLKHGYRFLWVELGAPPAWRFYLDEEIRRRGHREFSPSARRAWVAGFRGKIGHDPASGRCVGSLGRRLDGEPRTNMNKNKLHRLSKALTAFRTQDSEMQVQHMLIFLHVAVSGETTVKELCEVTGLAQSSVSRATAYFGKAHWRGNRQGLDLIVSHPDPDEPRRYRLSLTNKGQALVRMIEVSME